MTNYSSTSLSNLDINESPTAKKEVPANHSRQDSKNLQVLSTLNWKSKNRTSESRPIESRIKKKRWIRYEETKARQNWQSLYSRISSRRKRTLQRIMSLFGYSRTTALAQRLARRTVRPMVWLYRCFRRSQNRESLIQSRIATLHTFV